MLQLFQYLEEAPSELLDFFRAKFRRHQRIEVLYELRRQCHISALKLRNARVAEGA